MEDEIKILEEVCQRPIEETEGIKILRKAITNLINKYKEQKRDIRDNHILLAKYSQKNEEQEKIIELMAEYMATHKYIGYDFEHAFPQEIIEEFKKKARDENGNRNDN